MAVEGQVSAVKEVWPLLVVLDLEASIAFYRDALGFSVEAQAEESDRVFWCRLVRGGASIMLQRWDPEDGPQEGRGRGVSLYFLCDDVDAIYAELRSRRVDVEPPWTQDYGMRQLMVAEPDGYTICFESPC